MSTLTGTPTTTTADRTRRPRLRGMTWLVWRQHRATYWTVLCAGALLAAWMTYQHIQLMEFLDASDWTDKDIVRPGDQAEAFMVMMNWIWPVLAMIPVVLGVFVGAPLLAGDLEHGTSKLVVTQSGSGARWLATKLGVTALFIGVTMTVLSISYGRLSNALQDSLMSWMSWAEGSIFDNTGPVPVALSLFTVVGGVAIGLVLRRTLAAMVVTFGFGILVQVAWSYFRLSLGDVVSITTDKGVAEGSEPQIPDSAHGIDTSFITSNGDLLGTSTCFFEKTEQAKELCLKQADVVGWSVQYLPKSEMASMQWLGTSILLAMTAAVTVFLFTWGRKRLA